MAGDGSQLRDVFELCSPDDEGFILTEYLADKLAEQFNDQALVTIQDALDPEQNGRISFNQFCEAVTNLQSNEPLKSKPFVYVDEDDSSDPENTYNEYDIPEDEIKEMENMEIIGESPQPSPIKSQDPSEYFNRHGSFRRSHRRARSLTTKVKNVAGFETRCEEASSVPSEFDDLTEKVDILQGHVQRIEEDKKLQTQYELVKNENQRLTNRVNELEEKLQDITEHLNDVKKRSAQKLEDVHREHALQLMVLQSQIEVISADKKRYEAELDLRKGDAKESRNSLVNLQNQTELLTKQLMETNEEYMRLNQRFTSLQDKHESKQEYLEHTIGDLKNQLKTSQHEKSLLEVNLSQIKLDPTSVKLKVHVNDLQHENDDLKRKNDELTDQLAQNISDVRLMMCGDDQSIAQELSHATRDEVMEALVKQESMNDQLRNYLDRITLNILERDPGILEIKPHT